MRDRMIQVCKSRGSCFRFASGIIFVFILIFFMVKCSYANDCGGNVQCSCGDTLIESQEMWYDISDCSDNGLIIGADNITLNGNGHMITGAPDIGTHTGIYLEHRQGVSIMNCKVSEFAEGIRLEESTGNSIEKNITNDNDNRGIFVYRSSGSSISKNVAKGNIVGIELFYSLQNSVTHNATNNNNNGIVLYDCQQNTMTENIANHNKEQGIVLSHNSSENTVSDNITTFNESHGISLYGGSIHNLVSNNISNRNEYHGMILNHASFNSVYDNIIKHNQGDGMSLQTRDCEIWGNILEGNGYGMHLSDTDIMDFWDNTFINNEINAYEDAASLDNNWNTEEQGNWWSDFSSNPGYPTHYEIPGDGEGIDWYPSGN